MTHTPGPWIAENGYVPDWDDVKTVLISGPDGPGYGRVAQVYAECGRESELLPNARLIAAAPELLEALQALTESSRFHLKGSLTLKKARQAIAMATDA